VLHHPSSCPSRLFIKLFLSLFFLTRSHKETKPSLSSFLLGKSESNKAREGGEKPAEKTEAYL
jgi:hypothetical protein